MPDPGVPLTFARWRRSWAALGAEGSRAAYDDLVARYAEPHRAYHTMQHLTECFAQWEEVRGAAERPGEVELALWYHDAVYDPRREDNEARSAELARAAIMAAGLANASAIADRVAALILATRHDAPPAPGDEALLVDVDLAILAAAPARFDEYEAQVRAEYAWVPEPLFRWKRRRVLQALLDRPRLYTSPQCEALEPVARANLTRSLSRLGD